jgi:tetratricopeptide (TPR) repeat protein
VDSTIHNSFGQYETHELVRQYTAEKLHQFPDEQEQTLNRHCAYFGTFLGERLPALARMDRQALAELDTERENVRAGWQFALSRRKLSEIEQYIDGMFSLFGRRALYREGISVFKDAIAALDTHSDDEQTRLLLGKLLARQGALTCSLGFLAEAAQLLQESEQRLEGCGDRSEKAFTTSHLGLIAFKVGDHEMAQVLFEESYALSKAIGDEPGVARALNRKGLAAFALGEYDRAKALLEESYSAYRSVTDESGMANALDLLGYLLAETGDRASGKRLLEESLALHRKHGDPLSIASSLNNLGYVCFLLRMYAKARRFLEESLEISRSLANQYQMAICLVNLGYIAEAQDDLATARTHFMETLRIAANTQIVSVALDALVGLAMIWGKETRIEEALELAALVRFNPSTWSETKQRVESLFADFKDKLPPQLADAAIERGRGKSYEEVIAGFVHAS